MDSIGYILENPLKTVLNDENINKKTMEILKEEMLKRFGIAFIACRRNPKPPNDLGAGF